MLNQLQQYVYVYVCLSVLGNSGFECAIACMWRSEDNLQKVLFFYQVGSGDVTQIVRFSGNHIVKITKVDLCGVWP